MRPHEVIIDGVRYIPEVADDPMPQPEPPAQPAETFNAAAFFADVRDGLFHGSLSQEQVDGLNLIYGVCKDAGLDPHIEQTAYVLATVYHETGRRMQPVRETFADSDEQAVARLESAWKRGRLPWVKTPYWRVDANGKSWFGRGHVQLTWEANYRKQQDKLRRMGIEQYQVHDDPTLALVPATSAAICVYGMLDGNFTGKALDHYIVAGDVDYRNARRIVNGTDRAELIAGYAAQFERAIRAGLEAGGTHGGG